MIELPHEPANLSAADTALVGARDPGAMNGALVPVREARGRQAERERAAFSILEKRRGEHAAAERAHAIETTILEGLDEALAARGAALEALRVKLRLVESSEGPESAPARAEAKRTTIEGKRALAEARDMQAERAFAAVTALEKCRRAHAAVERDWQGERDALAHLDRAIAAGEARIEEERARLVQAREAEARRERERESVRRRVARDRVPA